MHSSQVGEMLISIMMCDVKEKKLNEEMIYFLKIYCHVNVYEFVYLVRKIPRVILLHKPIHSTLLS